MQASFCKGLWFLCVTIKFYLFNDSIVIAACAKAMIIIYEHYHYHASLTLHTAIILCVILTFAFVQLLTLFHGMVLHTTSLTGVLHQLKWLPGLGNNQVRCGHALVSLDMSEEVQIIGSTQRATHLNSLLVQIQL